MDMSHIVPPMMPEYHTNPHLVKKVVQQLKINGVFDEMRRECLADIDTKPAFQNLKQRVEGHVTGILSNQKWSPSLNKNQLRSEIRESVMRSGILNEGVDRILYQVFDAKVHSVFMPKILDFIKENGDELRKEFLPVPEVLQPDMQMMTQNFIAPPVPVPPGMPEQMSLPPIPAQPPPPESPIIPPPEEAQEKPALPPESASPKVVEEIEEKYYVKDIAPEDIIVKAINTPSPQHSSPESASATTPVIPEDAVNPLRNLIQSLLTSKSILNSQDSPGLNEQSSQDAAQKVGEGFSPTIDPSQIEAFTDDEEGSPRSHGQENATTHQGPATPSGDDHRSPKLYSPRSPQNSGASPVSPRSPLPQTDALSPPSPYSPVSDNNDIAFAEHHEKVISDNVENKYQPYDERSDRQQADDTPTPMDSKAHGADDTYDPVEFTFEARSMSPTCAEDTSLCSPPSPTSLDTNPETTDKSVPSDIDRYYSEGSKHDTDMRKSQPYPKSKEDARHSSSDGSISSSSASSPRDEITETVVQEVEEMVEEIEVVEEYVSEEEKSESDRSIEVKEKKKKKKSKKKKSKKSRKRKHSRSSSISSGEITSSGELTSDSSSGVRRPTRPNVIQQREPPMELLEMEERRRAMQRDENPRNRPPFWTNTESSSDYLSSPGRIRHPYSPPRRPYSPEFIRYENERNIEMGYGPPPGPHFRERHMYPPGHPGEFRPPIHHPRFSPPMYRRSPPPHRFSPGPRMDYPRPPPFGSPRSPPRRVYSPPPHHMIGGFPGDMRPGFPHPRHMHRFGSPPHPGMNPHRRPSRSPPPHPGLRMEDIPGPSKHMRY